MSFGEWLRDQLNASGLNNAELARRVGVSATYIGNLVRDFSQNTKTGKVRPSEEVVAKIARAFNADEDEARLAAGYAPIRSYDEQRNDIEELLNDLSKYGIDGLEPAGGLANYPPERFRDLKHDIETVIALHFSGRRPDRYRELPDLPQADTPTAETDSDNPGDVRTFTRDKRRLA